MSDMTTANFVIALVMMASVVIGIVIFGWWFQDVLNQCRDHFGNPNFGANLHFNQCMRANGLPWNDPAPPSQPTYFWKANIPENVTH